MKLSIGIYTNNSEKWIGKVLKRLYPYLLGNTELIIFDDMSKDETVPIIVSIIGRDFLKEEKYKFYINTSKKGLEETIKNINKVKTTDKLLIISQNINKRQLEKKVRDLLNDKN